MPNKFKQSLSSVWTANKKKKILDGFTAVIQAEWAKLSANRNNREDEPNNSINLNIDESGEGKTDFQHEFGKLGLAEDASNDDSMEE